MKPLVILTGPTAVGKTALSIMLATSIGGEIISADSMQVYRHMDIGTAKIKTSEMQGITHHLIDILEPDQVFNVVVFQKLAKQCLTGIYRRGKIPIVVGGTGFYIQALLYDINFNDDIDFNEDADEQQALSSTVNPYRQELFKLVAGMDREKSSCLLFQMLTAVDPAAAKDIHPHNHKRMIRALEYHHLTGNQISQHNQAQRQKQSPYNFAYFVLNDDRAEIYAKIEQRIDQMLADGLLDEVHQLKDKGYTRAMISMQGLGYKEILAYLDNELTFEQTVGQLKRDTRHFAKRQLTWFRREREVIWIDKPSFIDNHSIINFIRGQLLSKEIINS